MALTPITLRSLPGSPRDFNIPLNPGISAGVDQPTDAKVGSWLAGTVDLNEHIVDDEGQETTVERLDRKVLKLNNVVVNREIKRTLDDLKLSLTVFCVTPPWVDAVDVLTYLPLQDSGLDMRFKDTRGEVTFARECGVFNPINGDRVARNVMLHTDGVIGKHLHVGDFINDTHWPSMVWTFYLTRDASDSGSTTLLTVAPADAVLINAYYTADDDIFMVSTEGETANTPEIFQIQSINTTTGVLTVTTANDGGADAVLNGTSDWTRAKRSYIAAVSFVSDAEMGDSGTGSWVNEATPTLVEKSKTMNETGTQCLRVIGDAASDGVTQTLGAVPQNTNVILWARVKVIRGTLGYGIYNQTDGAWEGGPAPETTTSASWVWVRLCAIIDAGGAGQKTIRPVFRCEAAAGEFLVDRCYIFKGINNGGMEGAYTDEKAAEVVCDVAPGWDKLGTGAGDSLDESADEHGGDKAQYFDIVGGANRGIQTAVNVFTDGTWYLVGAFIKVIVAGQVKIRESGTNILTEITDASYTFQPAIYQGTGANKLEIVGTAGTEFLADDIMLIKLMGNVFDDGYYDLSEPLSTTGFTIAGLLSPDVANTALAVDAYLWQTSRRTNDTNNHAHLHYDKVNNRFEFFVISGGVAKNVTLSKTFTAGQAVRWAVRCEDGVDMDLDVGIGTSAESNANTADAAMDIPDGLTRMWFRDGNSYSYQARGSIGCILIANEVLSDADLASWFDIMDGTDANGRALLEETHGIAYRIQSINMKSWSTARGDMFKGDINLIEVERVGSLADRDAN